DFAARNEAIFQRALPASRAFDTHRDVFGDLAAELDVRPADLNVTDRQPFRFQSCRQLEDCTYGFALLSANDFQEPGGRCAVCKLPAGVVESNHVKANRIRQGNRKARSRELVDAESNFGVAVSNAVAEFRALDESSRRGRLLAVGLSSNGC